jgi:FkbM family methyltransferase
MKYLLSAMVRRLGRLPTTRSGRIAYRAVERLARLILRFCDPLLQHRIGATTIELPFSHRLPMYLSWFPTYDRALPRLAAQIAQRYPGSPIIDVGANVGDTAAMLRGAVDSPILCVEGDPIFRKILLSNAKRIGNVEVIETYVGESRGSVHAAPERKGGTATLVDKQTETTILRVDDIAIGRFAHAKLLKSDTDGYDARVLHGAESLMKLARPVLFFEYAPDMLEAKGDDALEIFTFLESLGYTCAIVWDNFGRLLTDVKLPEHRRLRMLADYYRGRVDQQYCDLAVFHRADEALCDEVLETEIGSQSGKKI